MIKSFPYLPRDKIKAPYSYGPIARVTRAKIVIPVPVRLPINLFPGTPRAMLCLRTNRCPASNVCWYRKSSFWLIVTAWAVSPSSSSWSSTCLAPACCVNVIYLCQGTNKNASAFADSVSQYRQIVLVGSRTSRGSPATESTLSTSAPETPSFLLS